KLIAVAIDRDKESQNALKWAIDNHLSRGQTIILIHVKVNQYGSSASQSFSTPSIFLSLSLYTHTCFSQFSGFSDESGFVTEGLDQPTKELIMPFRCFCRRKSIYCHDIVLEDTDVARALIDYVTLSAIDILVLGASKNGFFKRIRSADIPGSISKGVPNFCTVYVISKGKISFQRSATRSAPATSPLRDQILNRHHSNPTGSSTWSEPAPPYPSANSIIQCPVGPPKLQPDPTHSFSGDKDSINLCPRSSLSPFTHRKNLYETSCGELSTGDSSDRLFVSSGRISMDRTFPSPSSVLHSESFDMNPSTSRMSGFSDVDGSTIGSPRLIQKSPDVISHPAYSLISHASYKSCSSETLDDPEAELRRLKLEVKQRMDTYSPSCNDEQLAKEKAKEMHLSKLEGRRKVDEVRMAEETPLATVEKEKAKSRAALEAAEAAQRLAKQETQKRINVEMKGRAQAEEKNNGLDGLEHVGVGYRRYTIEQIEAATGNFSVSHKVGEGGYGPVYKGFLDHTQVAIKVLRPDAAHGRSQFQQEVEVLSCMRHPNMVLLLGACPEYGCLVYEYMARGSLEDCLFRKRGSPAGPVLSWQQRFRIAAEIGTGLLFLHKNKPKPLVHRDLKPANILLDRNYMSKISDVGLARLVPASVADKDTQYRLTAAAGTFCYIDPEYQQTGMLGVKSDVYSLGIMFLQIMTGRPPMGLAHHVGRAIEKGSFKEILDPMVPDWPVEEALAFAKMSLKCAELRRKDRPDLGKEVMPLLQSLRALGEESLKERGFY
ncbi:Non-specific serine/threonine protein kinase, partial [Bertholletia excelsa]